MINQFISPHPDVTELTPKYHVTFNSNVPPILIVIITTSL